MSRKRRGAARSGPRGGSRHSPVRAPAAIPRPDRAGSRLTRPSCAAPSTDDGGHGGAASRARAADDQRHADLRLQMAPAPPAGDREDPSRDRTSHPRPPRACRTSRRTASTSPFAGPPAVRPWSRRRPDVRAGGVAVCSPTILGAGCPSLSRTQFDRVTFLSERTRPLAGVRRALPATHIPTTADRCGSANLACDRCRGCRARRGRRQPIPRRGGPSGRAPREGIPRCDARRLERLRRHPAQASSSHRERQWCGNGFSCIAGMMKSPAGGERLRNLGRHLLSASIGSGLPASYPTSSQNRTTGSGRKRPLGFRGERAGRPRLCHRLVRGTAPDGRDKKPVSTLVWETRLRRVRRFRHVDGEPGLDRSG